MFRSIGFWDEIGLDKCRVCQFVVVDRWFYSRIMRMVIEIDHKASGHVGRIRRRHAFANSIRADDHVSLFVPSNHDRIGRDNCLSRGDVCLEKRPVVS